MFGHKVTKMNISKSDFWRLNLKWRRIVYSKKKSHRFYVLNSLGYVIRGKLDRGITKYANFLLPRDLKWPLYDLIRDVKFGGDVMCYYTGNPEYWLIYYGGLDFIEYHNPKLMRTLSFESMRINCNYSKEIIKDFKERGLITTEALDKMIEGLPGNHFIFPGNPGFDLRISYNY